MLDNETARHLKFRGLVRQIDLKRLHKQFKGSEYRKLIEQHVRALGLDKIAVAIDGCVTAFNASEREVAELMLDKYKKLAHGKSFWKTDCAEVFSNITDEFGHTLAARGCRTQDKMRFNAFQLVTLSCARAVLEDGPLRKLAEI